LFKGKKMAPQHVPEKPGLMKTWLEDFLANRPLLRRLAGRIVRPDEIEDIVQETFVLSFRAARQQKIMNPRAYMVKTMRNLALNHISRASHRLNQSMDEVEETEFSSFENPVEAHCQSEERFLAFCRAVATLPVACRRVFILKKVYGFSQLEIAAYLGVSPRTVEKHVEKGMLLTTEYMLGHGHAAGGAGGAAEDQYLSK
jgi:RNA polymerase sigma factor (sigma-70 family)